MPASRAMAAEFIGTFALMFVGGAAIIITGGENLLTIAFAHGLILAVMVSATIHISGGQINPAVSIALAIFQKQQWSRAGLFIIAQLLGSTVAALLLYVIFNGVYETGNIGATLGSLTRADSDHRSLPAAFGLEVIMTFFLMFVIVGTVVDKRGVGQTIAVGGLAIGLTVAANILCAGPLTGASMNPARSFGPALIAGAWDAHWLYWTAPLVGTLLATSVYAVLFSLNGESPKQHA